MTEEVKTPIADAALANQGVTAEDLSAGQTGGGNKEPPAPSNEAPKVKQGDDEEHGVLAKDAKATTEEVKKDETPKTEEVKDEKIGVTEYVKMDNPHAQAAIDVLKAQNVTPLEANAIFNKAIESGNLDDVDWKALEAKVGAASALLIKTGVENYYNEEFKEVQATVAKGHEIAGGEENWKKLVEWSNKKAAADPEYARTENEIRKAIKLNGFAAEAAVTKLKALYESDAKNGSLTKVIVTGDTNPAVSGTPLTRAEYMQELHKLHSRRHTPQERSSLEQRRQAGMKKGI